VTRNRHAEGEPPAQGCVRLSDLPVGFVARLHDTRLDAESRSELRALGLTDASILRVCKQGEPCVVQVRTTRIGVSGRIAQCVFVVPADGPAGDVRWP
jgi:Fe2+ transport system protein FeoA